MVEQNIFYACGLAALGACLNVVAVLGLALQSYKNDKDIHSKDLPLTEESIVGVKLSLPTNLGIQLASGFIHTVSTWYGPISIIMPVRVSAQLLFNLLFFGYLGVEEPSTDLKFGTFMVVSGAIFLPMFGPTIQQDQTFNDLLSEPLSLYWSIAISVIAAFAGFISLRFFIAKCSIDSVQNQFKFQVLLIARISSAVLSTSASKFLISAPGNFQMIFFIYIMCSFVIMIVAFLQVSEINDAHFVSASGCGVQLLNAMTGIIVWQDWRVVQSWAGYAIAMAQIIAGVYYISCLESFSQSADTDYSFTQCVTILLAKDIAHHSGHNGNKSIVAYAGGNLKAMLSGDTMNEKQHFENEKQLTSCNSSVDEANDDTGNLKLVSLEKDNDQRQGMIREKSAHAFDFLDDTDRLQTTSFASYRSINSTEKYAESFKA